MPTPIPMRVSASESAEHPDPSNPGQLVLRSHIKLVSTDNVNFPDAVFEVKVSGTAAAVQYYAGRTLTVTVGDPT